MHARNLIDLEVSQQSCQPFTVGVLRNSSDERRTFGRGSREHIEQHAGSVLADGREDAPADVVRRDQDVPPDLESVTDDVTDRATLEVGGRGDTKGSSWGSDIASHDDTRPNDVACTTSLLALGRTSLVVARS